MYAQQDICATIINPELFTAANGVVAYLDACTEQMNLGQKAIRIFANLQKYKEEEREKTNAFFFFYVSICNYSVQVFTFPTLFEVCLIFLTYFRTSFSASRTI